MQAIRYVKKTADQTTAAGALANVTSMSFTVDAGLYYAFHFIVMVSSANVGNGAKLGLTYPAATNFAGTVRALIAVDGTDAEFLGALTSSGDSVNANAAPVINTPYVYEVVGAILPSADGTLQLQFASTDGANNVTVEQGSIGILHMLT